MAPAQFPRRMMSQILLTAWSTDCLVASLRPFPLPLSFLRFAMCYNRASKACRRSAAGKAFIAVASAWIKSQSRCRSVN
ncbi:MAG TPA: hypothetical protein VLQ80_16500 [Candidatus Saccharimonadia bacterium]|nr:hypothetical protein [Candidatus Saccharimonadia bacterium]